MDLNELVANPPLVHGLGADGRPVIWTLGPSWLKLIGETVQPGWHTLETGAGASTVVFALRQANHVCIVPAPNEIKLIREFCQEHGLSTERITFVDQPSEAVLPGLDLEPLDLVLLDGSHSFPSVFIDWYYAAGRLKEGGWLVVDDIHLWTGRVLRDFLDAEGGWELVNEDRLKTAVFRKLTADSDVPNWVFQPYVVGHSALTSRARVAAMLGAREWGRALLEARIGLRDTLRRRPE